MFFPLTRADQEDRRGIGRLYKTLYGLDTHGMRYLTYLDAVRTRKACMPLLFRSF